MEQLTHRLSVWMENNGLKAEFISDRVFKIADKSFYLIPEIRQKDSSVDSVFTESFEINISQDDEDYANEINVGNLCFEFGNNFYYTPLDSIEDPQLNILKYIGSSESELDVDYAFLGMRGKFELCNGSGDYKEWVQKSKFLGVKSLAIAEHNTLAGTLQFQQTCQSLDMPFVLGETITVKDSSHRRYLAKCYALNEQGWFNLLYINKTINVDNVDQPHISESDLMSYGAGVILVLDSETPLSDELIEAYSGAFEDVYYQLDLTEYKGQEKDKSRLLAHKEYIENYRDKIKPILIQDAFYLDKEYSHIKDILNGIGKVKYQYSSTDQWYKSLDEMFMQWAVLFEDDDARIYDLFINGAENTMRLAERADYAIDTSHRHLPKFVNTRTDESDMDLLFRLIGEGMAKHGLEDKQEYWDRIDEEMRVIQMGDVVDYFLILWDIIEFCKDEDILTGVGRGSAGGSLIAYLLGITAIDPIPYDLLFERFLNEGRLFSKKKVDVIVVTDENGLDIELDFDEKVTILRSNQEQIVNASELQEGDNIIKHKGSPKS